MSACAKPVVVVFASWWSVAAALLVLVLVVLLWTSYRHLKRAADAFDQYNRNREHALALASRTSERTP